MSSPLTLSFDLTDKLLLDRVWPVVTNRALLQDGAVGSRCDAAVKSRCDAAVRRRCAPARSKCDAPPPPPPRSRSMLHGMVPQAAV